MKRFKKVIRLICFFMFILLASVGVGLVGAIDMKIFRRPETEPITIEMVDSAKEKSTVGSEEYKP